MTAFISTVLATSLATLGSAHFVRPAGSYVEGQSRDKEDTAGGEDIAGWLQSLEWSEVTEEAFAMGAGHGTCRYWRAELPEGATAFEAVALLSELNEDELEEVRCRRGHHGSVEHVASSIEPRGTKVLHLITGEHNGETVAFTWYPGRLTPPNETVKLG